MNPRITPKERNLLKGAIRRVFSRSELRRSILSKAKVEHKNEKRPRVKTWYKCEKCKDCYAGYEMQVDHVFPIIPTDKTLEVMTWDEVVDNLWCEDINLSAICMICHKIKTKAENKERRKRNKK